LPGSVAERGAVVQQDGRHFVVWDIRLARAYGVPIRPQTGPRHRAHLVLAPHEAHRLGLRSVVHVIATEDEMTRIYPEARRVGTCTTAQVIAIATTIRRAGEARVAEDTLRL
jgi:hypothetical protein